MHKSSLIILGSRTEGARILLALHFAVYGSIHHLVLPGRPLRVYLSLFSIYTSTVFPAFCLLCIPGYICHFLLLPSACTPTRRAFRERERPSPDRHSISLFSRGASRCRIVARARERGDLGLRNAKISSIYTRRFGQEREATSWDSSATKRRISNYDLLLRAPSFRFHIRTNNISLSSVLDFLQINSRRGRFSANIGHEFLLIYHT